MPLSTIERVLFLKSAEIFNGIASEDMVPVALVAQEVRFEAGQTFMHQGEPSDCLYVIVDGEVDIQIPGVGTIATRGPKTSVGEMGIVSHQPRSADCVAHTAVTALKIDHDDFWDVLAEKPPLALGIIRTLVQRLDEAVENLRRLGQRP